MNGPSERVRAMWRRYERGASMTQVASEFGVGAGRVSALFKKYGYPVERGGPQVRRSLRVVRMRALYETGIPMREIGRRFGITSARVSQLFAEAGFDQLAARHQSLTADDRRARARKRLGNLIEAYRGGATVEEVGRALGVTGARANQLLAEAGVERRRPGGLRITSFGEARGWRREPRSSPAIPDADAH